MSYVNYHPVFLALEGKRILIVGGGNVAVEKLESLFGTGAAITVISPEAKEEILAWERDGSLKLTLKAFEESDLDGFFMVIAATDQPEVNARVFEAGNSRSLLSNSVDDPVNCNFIMSAIARQGPMQVAVSSAGCSPAMAQRLRKKIAEELLTPHVGNLTEFLGSWRGRVKDRLHGYKAKQAFWESVIDSDLPAILAAQGWEAADQEMARKLDSFPGGPGSGPGKVTLVGAGPGDPDLITVKGLDALRTADVILYDRLVNPKLLEHCRVGATLIDVGKAPGECGRPRQETIHALLIEHASRGRMVVRLKGGDPFVFGRGGEEILALREARVEYEVVPGVSSSIAAPGAVDIPVTHRGLATGFAVFTAQGAAQDLETVPWNSLKEMPTLVLLMGVEQLPKIVENLRLSGRSEDTPIAIISQATLENEQFVTGTISTIATLAKDLPSPATIVVGEVVKLGRGFSEKGGRQENLMDYANV